MKKDLCHKLLHKAACGHLVQGLVHNMSGPLQILSMQIELLGLSFMKLKKDPANVEDFLATQEQKLSQIQEQLDRLKSILESINEIALDSSIPININEVLKKMLVFWEGDLKFKHNVPKEANLAEEDLVIFAPPAPIHQGFCALFWAVVPTLVEREGALFLRTFKDDSPNVEIRLENIPCFPAEDPFYEVAHELLSPYFNFNVSQNVLRLKHVS
ncbi:hypothetical protein [Thermodesulfatator atlanticus]